MHDERKIYTCFYARMYANLCTFTRMHGVFSVRVRSGLCPFRVQAAENAWELSEKCVVRRQTVRASRAIHSAGL